MFTIHIIIIIIIIIITIIILNSKYVQFRVFF